MGSIMDESSKFPESWTFEIFNLKTRSMDTKYPQFQVLIVNYP